MKKKFIRRFPEKNRGKVDYDIYILSWRQWLQYLAEALLLCGIINYLFYKNWIVFLFMLPIPVWYVRQRKQQQIFLRKRRLHYQFRDALSALQVGISAGYSVENAVKEARKDLERIHGKKAEMTQEFYYLEAQLSHSVPLESLFYDLGVRSRIEDILNFSDILVQSKKMGGNMRLILQKCITSMEERIDVKKEIDTMLASRKMEQKIMSMIPLGIILYMQFTSPGFLSVLYGTPAGIATMTFCLVLYLAAYQWGAGMVQIDV